METNGMIHTSIAKNSARRQFKSLVKIGCWWMINFDAD